jgi:homoserine kinase type II
MAVYTEVTDEELITFVAGYSIGKVTSCKGIAEGTENSNYLLTTDKGSYILTLYEKRVAADDLPFFLGLMGHLAERGVACPTPLENNNGQALNQLCGRNAAIISFLEGMWPRRPSPDHCAGIGQALAKLHLAGADFNIKRTNALSVGSWRELLQASGARADEVKPGLYDILAQEIEELEAYWPRPSPGLPSGVIHADLFPDNVFFKGNELSGLIDFYFACNDIFAYDVAICLNAWCFETDGSFNTTKARRMLSSYCKVRIFSKEELAALPLLARGSAMRFLLTRLYDCLYTPKDAIVTIKDPLEYLERLQFHQAIINPSSYGLDLA